MAAAAPAAAAAAAAAAGGGAFGLLAPVLSLGGLLDGLSPGLQVFVLALVLLQVGAVCVWVAYVSAELRLGKKLRKAGAD
jgi:hypothetical protein